MNNCEKILNDRQFSNEEKKEVESMMKSVSFYFDNKKTLTTVNFLAVASFQADTLSLFGTTPKVRKFGLQVHEKIKKLF